MKRIVLCLTIILLLLVACDKNCLNTKEKPKNLKPIDWENYNDVNTVFWNFYGPCEDFYNMNNPENIMIYGWINTITKNWVYFNGENYDWLASGRIELVDNPNFYNDSGSKPTGYWVDLLFPVNEFKAKLDSSDLTKKCFIKGKLRFNPLKMGFCCRNSVEIVITDINDIYFE